MKIEIDVDETFCPLYIPSDLLVSLGPSVPSYGVSPTFPLLANWHVFGPRRCRTQYDEDSWQEYDGRC